jgi:hypothetical protein
MKISLRSPLAAVLCIGLLGSVASAAPKSQVKECGSILIDIALAAQAGAPVGVSGSGQIEITKRKFKSGGTATLTLTTAGLPAGTYAVDATLSTSVTPVHIGDFVVTGAVPAAPGGDAPIELPIAPTVDAEDITSLTIADSATSTVVLAGDATVTSVDWKYIANVRIEAREIQNENAQGFHGGGKSVHGHLISHSFIKDSVEKQRHFLWVAFGAPKDTELTINVDGVAVGTVKSTKSGKVGFHGMPEPVVLRNIRLITLTDPLGAVVMQAKFE